MSVPKLSKTTNTSCGQIDRQRKMLICYCQKCDIVEKKTWDELDNFRKHLAFESTERCLEKGQYDEANTGLSCCHNGVKDTSFYVMASNNK